jgi:hypothetical protein
LRRLVSEGVDPYVLARELEGSMILPELGELRGTGAQTGECIGA